MDITRRIVFHSGHMLKDDNSKCYHPHGHEYVLECTIKGSVKESGAENGMVLNFGNLKSILMTRVHDLVDHKFILEKEDFRTPNFLHAVGGQGVHLVNFPPTAENLVKYFYEILSDTLKEQTKGAISISHLKLQETYQCWVEYAGS